MKLTVPSAKAAVTEPNTVASGEAFVAANLCAVVVNDACPMELVALWLANPALASPNSHLFICFCQTKNPQTTQLVTKYRMFYNEEERVLRRILRMARRTRKSITRSPQDGREHRFMILERIWHSMLYVYCYIYIYIYIYINGFGMWGRDKSAWWHAWCTTLQHIQNDADNSLHIRLMTCSIVLDLATHLDLKVYCLSINAHSGWGARLGLAFV